MGDLYKTGLTDSLINVKYATYGNSYVCVLMIQLACRPFQEDSGYSALAFFKKPCSNTACKGLEKTACNIYLHVIFLLILVY